MTPKLEPAPAAAAAPVVPTVLNVGTSSGGVTAAVQTVRDTSTPILDILQNVTNSTMIRTPVGSPNALRINCSASQLELISGSLEVQLRPSDTAKVRCSAAGLGLNGVAPVAQAARAGQLTDNSGGTSGGSTIAAITGAVDPTAATVASTANAIATLAARVNALELMLHNIGVSA